MQTAIIYEHPLNELMRLSLRLEFLFDKIDQHIGMNNTWQIRILMESLIHIAHLLERPDLKTKYAKTLQSQIASLNLLRDQNSIDQEKLKRLIDRLQKLFDHFNQTHGKIGQALRENQFIASLHQHLLYPGGEAYFELPQYTAWLNQPKDVIEQQIRAWLSAFDHTRAVTKLLLKLTRHRGALKEVTANDGYHQEDLDSKSNIQLIRIKLDADKPYYPLVSASKHRLNIRFNRSAVLDHEDPVNEMITFGLECCQ
ncbi:MAG: cell division protein ZapD [Gammaproteobacteria bacterium]